jgi:hypothetical protein
MAILSMKGKRKTKNPMDSVWGEVKNYVDRGLELRRPMERQAIVNLAFLTGNQHTFFNATAHTLHQILFPAGTKKVTDNILLPKWVREVSNLIKSRPKIAVIPNSTQEEDILAAKMGTKMAEWYYREVLLKRKIRKLAAWIYATGNAFLDDRWNPKKGPWGINKETGQVEYAGDVDAEIWSPFEVVVPASFGDDELQDFPWIAKMKRKTLEYFEENYDRGGEVREEQIGSGYITLEALVSGLTGDQHIGRAPSAFLIQFYQKPCKKFPRGRVVHMANGVVLEKNDYPFVEYSLEHFKDLDFPGLFWGVAKMSHGIGLQRSWNRNLTSLENFNVVAGKAKLLTPRKSNIEVMPDDGHGERLAFSPVLGHEPKFLDLKSLPPTIDKSMDWTQFSLENLFSQHEVSRGTNRSDIRSGDMVGMLLEQDAHGGIPSHSVFEESLESHLRRILLRMQVGYKTERLMKLGETTDDFEAFYFKGADLRGNRDVKVVKSSSLPDSPLARKKEVLDRHSRGLYGNPQDPAIARKVLRLIEDNIVDDVYSVNKQDENLQRWENGLIMKGQRPMVNDYDNHGIHVEEIDRTRKSIRYQQMRFSDPQTFTKIDIAFSLHRQEHVRFLNEQMMKQMQLQGGLNGEARG